MLYESFYFLQNFANNDKNDIVLQLYNGKNTRSNNNLALNPFYCSKPTPCSHLYCALTTHTRGLRGINASINLNPAWGEAGHGVGI